MNECRCYNISDNMNNFVLQIGTTASGSIISHVLPTSCSDSKMQIFPLLTLGTSKSHHFQVDSALLDS